MNKIQAPIWYRPLDDFLVDFREELIQAMGKEDTSEVTWSELAAYVLATPEWKSKALGYEIDPEDLEPPKPVEDYEYQKFNEWFKASDLDEQHRSAAILAWNKAVEQTTMWFGEMEGTDYHAYEEFFVSGEGEEGK